MRVDHRVGRARFRRNLWTTAGLCLLACGLTGCQVGRSWFQMHSDNPTPAVGIDLVPKPKSDRNNIRKISLAADEAELPAPPAVAPEPDSRWSKWWKGLGKPKRIPLPRTDVPQPADDRDHSDDRDAAADFDDFTDGGF